MVAELLCRRNTVDSAEEVGNSSLDRKTLPNSILKHDI